MHVDGPCMSEVPGIYIGPHGTESHARLEERQQKHMRFQRTLSRRPFTALTTFLTGETLGALADAAPAGPVATAAKGAPAMSILACMRTPLGTCMSWPAHPHARLGYAYDTVMRRFVVHNRRSPHLLASARRPCRRWRAALHLGLALLLASPRPPRHMHYTVNT